MSERSKFPDELLEEKFGNLHNLVHARYNETDKKLDTIIGDQQEIKTQVTYTNGKVRKIIVALIGVGFFSLGLGFEQLAPIVKLLLAV